MTSKGFTAETWRACCTTRCTRRSCTLPDDDLVWPAHGAGSACGRNIGKELHSTLGDQRRFNPNLAPMSRAAFVALVTTDLAPAPDYFGFDAETNRVGAAPLGDLPEPPALAPAEAFGRAGRGRDRARRARGRRVLRRARAGRAQHRASPASSPRGRARCCRSRRRSSWSRRTPRACARRDSGSRASGSRTLSGYLDGGLAEWARVGRPVEAFENISVRELAERIEHGAAPIVFDVRRRANSRKGTCRGRCRARSARA